MGQQESALEGTPPPPTTPFISLVKQGNLDGVKQLVAVQGPEVAAEVDQSGHTSMHWAAMSGDLKMLTYLDSINVPFDAPTEDDLRMLPIHWAASKGQKQSIEFFIVKGLSIDSIDGKLATPLITAAQHGWTTTVHWCLTLGADHTHADSSGDTVFHWAAYNGLGEIVERLLTLGADPTAPDCFGHTPLHIAARRAHNPIVELLLDKDGGLAAISDKEGMTPSDGALAKSHYLTAILVNSYLPEPDSATDDDTDDQPIVNPVATDADEKHLAEVDGGEQPVHVDGGEQAVHVDGDEQAVHVDGDEQPVHVDGGDGQAPPQTGQAETQSLSESGGGEIQTQVGEANQTQQQDDQQVEAGEQ